MRLKKVSILLLVAILLTALTTACSGSSHTVEFYVDGELYDTYTVKNGGYIEDVPAVPVKEGKTGRWSRNDFDEITSDMRVNAIYTDAYYTVTFIADGTTVKEIAVKYNAQLNEIPDVPVKTGYTGKWSITDFSGIDRNIAVYAEYEPTDARIEFFDGETLLYSRSVPVGERLANVPEVPDYGVGKVSGRWIVMKDGQKTAADFSSVKGDMTVFVDYYVSVMLVNDGRETEAICELGKEIDGFDFSEKDGYDFVGWYEDENYRRRISFPYEFTENTKIYGRWLRASGDAEFSFDNGYITGYEGARTEIVVPYRIGNETVIGIAEGAFANSDITKITLPATLTEVGNGAFENCLSLREVVYSDGCFVERIGSLAFKNCSSLKEFLFSDFLVSIGEYAFYGCSGMEEYENFSSTEINTIPDYAFAENGNLFNLALPAGIIAIGAHAFENDVKTSFVFADDVALQSVGKYAFYNCYSITAFKAHAIRQIGEYAFGNCRALTYLSLPSDTKAKLLFGTESGGYFYEVNGRFVPYSLHTVYVSPVAGGTVTEESLKNINSVKYVQIGQGVKKIGDYAFCLEAATTEKAFEIIFSETVKEIGDYAFSGRNDLSSLDLPSSLERIGEYAFGGIASLKTVSIGGNSALSYVGKGAFNGTSWYEEYKGVIKIGRVVLGVTEKYLNSVGKTTLTAEDFVGADTISPFAFSGNSVLQSVTVPSDIYRIYDRAFIDCKKLTEAEISASTNVGFTEIIDGAEVVRNSVFDGCVRLAKLTIGLDVKIEELFGNEPETGFTLFKGGYLPDALKELVLLPDEISTVKKGAYNGLTTVEKIVISDGITAIEDGAFVDCAIKEIIIADSVVSIGYNGEDYTESRTSSIEYVGTFGSTLQKVVFTENSSLRAIFDNAFRHTLLADIALPASLEYIGKYAFADNGCEYINALTFGDSGSSLIIDSYAFENVKFNPSDGYEVRFPSGLREIAEGAFKNCAGLFGVAIGNNLSLLGEEAFAYSGLKSFDIPESVAYTDGEGEVIFKNLLSGTSVTELTLRKPVKVTELFATVPASLAKVTVYGDVGQETFFGMSGLKNAIIEDAINIGSHAFYDCDGLVRIELPATVKSIGDFAFAECANLTTFIIKTGSELKSIGEYVFKNDEKLLSAFLPATVENDVFTGVFYGCKSLTATSAIPSTVKTIGDETFYGCEKLTSVSIPEEAERIGAEAFFGCVSMEIDNVRFDSLVSIGDRAFYNCAMITGIKAQNILSTGAEAFYGCASLEEISVADASIAAITDSPLTVLTVNISSAINVLPTGVFDGATAIQNVMVYSESDYINDLLEGIALAISEDCKVFVTENGYLKISDEIKNGVLSGKIFVNPTAIDATFVYDEEKRTAKIASVGNYSGAVIFFPAYTYKEGISGDIEEYAVTSIGERVLAECAAVKEIIVPYTVESIDGRAFKGSDISSVRFETGSRLATIGEEAFRECAFLKEIKLPNGVKEIKRAAFYESGLTSLRVNSFGNLAVIESYAFYNCSGLKSMTIEASSLSDIQAYAFAGSGLESVAINENCKLKSVGEYAFANCNGLTRETVVFPVGAVVADNAFANY